MKTNCDGLTLILQSVGFLVLNVYVCEWGWFTVVTYCLEQLQKSGMISLFPPLSTDACIDLTIMKSAILTFKCYVSVISSDKRGWWWFPALVWGLDSCQKPKWQILIIKLFHSTLKRGSTEVLFLLPVHQHWIFLCQLVSHYQCSLYRIDE